MLEFTTQSQGLLNALNKVVTVVAKKNTMHILDTVRIQVFKGALKLTCTNLEEHITYKIYTDEENAEGEAVVEAHLLLKIIKRFKKGEKVWGYVKDNELVIRKGDTKLSLPTFLDSDFPEPLKNEKTDTSWLEAEDLMKSIKRCNHAMADDDVRYYLNGMLFEFEDRNLTLVATDGYRMALDKVAMQDGVEDKQLIIPIAGVKLIQKVFAKDTVSLGVRVCANHLTISSQFCTVSLKAVAGRFPNYRQVIQSKNAAELAVNRLEILETVGDTLALSSDKYPNVHFEGGKHDLKIHNKPLKPKVEARHLYKQGRGVETLQLSFNAVYLKDALSVLARDEVFIEEGLGDNKIQIQEGDFRVIIKGKTPSKSK